MKIPNSKNKRFDRIGRKLLETTRMRSDEIERIVAAPELFDSVLARIKAEQSERKPENFFVGWRNSSVWSRQRISIISAVAAFFLFGAAGLIVIDKSIRINEQFAAIPVIQITPGIPTPITITETRQTPRIPEHSPEITSVKYSVSASKKSLNKPVSKKRS